MKEENKFPKSFVIVSAIFIVIGIFVLVWYVQKAGPDSFYNQLLEKNEEFSYAEGLLKSGKFDEATSHYKLALEKAEGYKEEGQLKYKIALTKIRGSQPIESIALFKEVATNENYTPVIRAYAVQNIGGLLYSYDTLEIRREVFKDEPFKSFWIEGNYSLSRRKLFEYASSFYPLGIPELRIAKWYSTEVLRLAKSRASDEETKKNVESIKSVIRQKLLNVDKYLLEISEDEQARIYTAEVLYRKGMVLGDILLSGDTTFEGPEDAFNLSLNFSAIGNIHTEASAKFLYAVFLAKMYGEKRADDIKKLLGDFYTKDVYKNTTIVRSLKITAGGSNSGKSDGLLLAKIDSNFAAFLETLGWTIK